MLQISKLNLTKLPPEMEKFSNLKELYAWGNKLTSFPPVIAKFKELRVLDFGYNGLTAFPNIWELTNLTNLCLFGNKIESIPDKINTLSKLNTLNLDDNQLIKIPPLKELTELRYLELKLDPEYESGITPFIGLSEDCQVIITCDNQAQADELNKLWNNQEMANLNLSEDGPSLPEIEFRALHNKRQRTH